MSAFDHDRHDAITRSFQTSNQSEPHLGLTAGDVNAITGPRLSQPQKSSRSNKPAALCSSNDGFLRNINSGWSIPLQGDKNTYSLPSAPKELWKRAESSMMLPRRPVADSLLNSFFTFAHDFLPIFHRPAFQRRYESLWVSSAPARPSGQHEKFEDGVFLSTLNVCFALGSLFSELIANDDRESTGDEYYQRSRALTNLDICDYSP